MKHDHETTRALVALRKLKDGSGPRALSAVMGCEKGEAEKVLSDLAYKGLVTPPNEVGICYLTEQGRTALS